MPQVVSACEAYYSDCSDLQDLPFKTHHTVCRNESQTDRPCTGLDMQDLEEGNICKWNLIVINFQRFYMWIGLGRILLL